MVVLGTLTMFGVFIAGAFLDVPLVHRFVLLAVFFFCRLGWCSYCWRSPRAVPRCPAGLAGVVRGSPRRSPRRGCSRFSSVSNVQTALARFAEVRRWTEPDRARGQAHRADRRGSMPWCSAIRCRPGRCRRSGRASSRCTTRIRWFATAICGRAPCGASSRRALRTPSGANILVRYGVTHLLLRPRDAYGSVARFAERYGVPTRLPSGMTLYTLTPEARSAH